MYEVNRIIKLISTFAPLYIEAALTADGQEQAEPEKEGCPMTAGRPTEYKAEYCEDVIALGKQGKSPAQMASAFDVSRQTIDNWAKANTEFLEALNRALAHCQAWWEDKGQTGMETAGFNAAVWKKSVEARFRDDYTERKEVSSTLRFEDILDQLR